jgi:hypothetical protein
MLLQYKRRPASRQERVNVIFNILKHEANLNNT